MNYSQYKDTSSDSLTAAFTTAQSLSAGESTEERHTRTNPQSSSGGIQNSELQAHLVSNDDLLLSDLEHGRNGNGGGEEFSVSPGDHDPFYVVKEDVLIKLEMTDDALERYQRTVENTVRFTSIYVYHGLVRCSLVFSHSIQHLTP